METIVFDSKADVEGDIYYINKYQMED